MPESKNQGACKDCGAPVIFEKSKGGAWLPPLDPSGDPHFHTCPAGQVTIRRSTLAEHTRNVYEIAVELTTMKLTPKPDNWKPPWEDQ